MRTNFGRSISYSGFSSVPTKSPTWKTSIAKAVLEDSIAKAIATKERFMNDQCQQGPLQTFTTPMPPGGFPGGFPSAELEDRIARAVVLAMAQMEQKQQNQYKPPSFGERALHILASEAEQAALIVAADQLLKTARPILLATLEKTALPYARALSEIISSPFGEFILAFVVGSAISTPLAMQGFSRPMSHQEGRLIQLGALLRTRGMAAFGNQVADVFLTPLREAASEALKALPSGE